MSPELESAIAAVCVVAGLTTVAAGFATGHGWCRELARMRATLGAYASTVEALRARVAELEAWRTPATEALTVLAARTMRPQRASLPPPPPAQPEGFQAPPWASRDVQFDYHGWVTNRLRGPEFQSTMCAPEFHYPRER